MSVIFFLILACCCVLSFFSGRYWLGSILVIGFLQDPFRKLAPNEPVYFVVLVGILFAFILISQLLKNGTRQSLEPFIKWTTELFNPITLFIFIVLLQFVHSFLRYGSFTMSFIGLISYTAPLLAIVIGYSSVNNVADIRRFMKFYSCIGVILAITVVLSFIGYDWQIFKEIGEGLKIYDQGTVLRSFSGFMRTGEVAAWHISTSACFLMVLVATSERRSTLFVTLVIALVLLMIVSISLTGRRKMLMLVSLFSIFYLIGYLYYRRSLDLRYTLVTVFAVVMLWAVVEALFPGGYGSAFENYLARGTSVYTDASERFVSLGITPISWAIDRVGIFGGGLGIASQGAQLFSSVNVAGGSGEGGLGKIVVELGVPGLLVLLWVFYRFSIYLNNALKLSAQNFVPNKVMPMAIGVAVILAVNGLTFSVATQVYGDIFILLMLGLLSGFLFALPKLVLGSLDSVILSNTQLARVQKPALS